MTSLPPDSLAGRNAPSVHDQVVALQQQAMQRGADVLSVADQLTALSRLTSATDLVAAVEPQQAAVDLLAGHTPSPAEVTPYWQRYAEALHNLAQRLFDVGRDTDGLAAANAAIPAYRTAGGFPDADQLGLSWQLTLLSKLFTAHAATDSALLAQQTCVQLIQLYQPSDASQTAARDLALAHARHNLTARLIDAGQRDTAAQQATEATDEYRTIAQGLWRSVGTVVDQLVGLARDLAVAGQDAASAAARRAANDAYNAPPSNTPNAPDPAATPPIIDATARVFVFKSQLFSLTQDTVALVLVLTAGGLPGLAAGAQSAVPAPGQRFCGVADNIGPGDLEPLAIGTPLGHWTKRHLVISIDDTGCLDTAGNRYASASDVQAAIAQWATVTVASTGGPPMFTFAFTGPVVPTPPGASAPPAPDIVVTFVGVAVEPAFGAPGGVDGRGVPTGFIHLDSGELWSQFLLTSVTVHEMGHVLGLGHSNVPNSTMYPYGGVVNVIDQEAQDGLRRQYGWQPQHHLAASATSDRPAMAATHAVPDLSQPVPHMVWKGSTDDPRIYHAVYTSDPDTFQPNIGNDWGPQQPIAGPGTSHAPAVTEINMPPDARTGLLMAWKGQDDDPRIYWRRFSETRGWIADQQAVGGAGTSAGPALATLDGRLFLAWKGRNDDEGLYWSWTDARDGAGSSGRWAPQRQVAGVASAASPALAVLHGRLYMFWRGAGTDVTGWWSVLDPTSLPDTPSAAGSIPGGPDWAAQQSIQFANYTTGPTQFFPIAAGGALAAATRANDIFLSWRGAGDDQRIWISTFDGASFSGQISLDNTGTAVGVGALSADTLTLLTWRGIVDDRSLYYSYLA